MIGTSYKRIYYPKNLGERKDLITISQFQMIGLYENNMDKVSSLIDRIIKSSSWEEKRRQAKYYLSCLDDSLIKSPSYIFFLESLAKKDILTAAYASGKKGRHFVARFLSVSPEGIDICFIECCLLLDFVEDLKNYLLCKINDLTEQCVKEAIHDIRYKTDDILLLRFLRILNLIDCDKDYVDDVFLDCPIDTPDFKREEHLFCQELFAKKRYAILYEYMAMREQLDGFYSILHLDKNVIINQLNNDIGFGSLLLLLSINKTKTIDFYDKLAKTLESADINTDIKKICLFFCCLNACETMGCLPDDIKEILNNLNCDSNYLLKYRKYIGNQEILCFKKLLYVDKTRKTSNCLLEFLRLAGANNTFSEVFLGKKSMIPIVNKNKKYIQDNKNFSQLLDESDYSPQDKDFIRRNTHLRMYGFEPPLK